MTPSTNPPEPMPTENKTAEQLARDAAELSRAANELAQNVCLEIYGASRAWEQFSIVEALCLDALTQSTAAQSSELEALRETIEFARNHHGNEARACPLCIYENGVFKGYCEPHKQLSQKDARIRELEKALEWSNRVIGYYLDHHCHAQNSDYDAPACCQKNHQLLSTTAKKGEE